MLTPRTESYPTRGIGDNATCPEILGVEAQSRPYSKPR